MQYLEGPERSVDCVAYQGSLVLAVSRVKLPDRQIMETAGPAIDVARRLCRRYRLDGLFNVQLRDAGGRPHLLEINARMSGGLSYTASTGVILPYWAIMLHLGLRRPEDVPAPRPGAVVTTPAPGAGGARLSVG
jgi:biotin carboxylase